MEDIKLHIQDNSCDEKTCTETSIKKGTNFNAFYLKDTGLWMISVLYYTCLYFLYFSLWVCDNALSEQKRDVNKILRGKAKKKVANILLAIVTGKSKFKRH